MMKKERITKVRLARIPQSVCVFVFVYNNMHLKYRRISEIFYYFYIVRYNKEENNQYIIKDEKKVES